VSLSLNIVSTLAISGRLLYFRWTIGSVLGSSQASQYTGIVALIVESAAIYSTFSLLFLVPFALNHPLNQVFFQALSGVQVNLRVYGDLFDLTLSRQIVATLLIIFRVAEGKSWSADTISQWRSDMTPSNAHYVKESIKFSPTMSTSNMGSASSRGGMGTSGTLNEEKITSTVQVALA
jgi:hypothetical protein